MNSDQAQQALQAFYQTRKNPLQSYQEAVDSLGIPDVRTRVASLRSGILNTENLLNGVEGSVTGRTQGSLVTEAQRQRMTALERAPIAQQLQGQTGNLSNEQTNLNTLEQQAQQRANLEQTDFGNKENALKQALQFAQQKEQIAREEQARQQELAQKQQELAQRRVSGGGRSGPTNRDLYNTDLANLENSLKNGRAPHYEDAVRALVQKYSSRGVSPQEIGDYLYQLYGRFFNTSQTKKFYG